MIVTFGAGTLNLLPGTTSIGEMSDKYQTIVSPSGSAFSIWGVIFIAQGIFAIGQMLPKYRSSKAVQDGLKYWYFLVCIDQALWTLLFGYEQINLSLICIASIWILLVIANISQYNCKLERTQIEFWMLRFPFMIHCGWLTAATALNLNVVVVNSNASASVQLTSGIISLAVLHAIAMIYLWFIKYPNYVIPCVLIWANFWIGMELRVPMDQITNLFGAVIINGVKNAAFGVAVIVLIQVLARTIFALYQWKFSNSTVDHLSDSTSTQELVDEGVPVEAV